MTIDPLLFTLLIELLVVTSVVVVAMFLHAFLHKKRDRKAAQALAVKLNEGQEQRVGESREILTTRFGLDGELAAKLATEIDGAERGFYQAMIATYLRRDHVALENMDVGFMGAVEAYRTLTPSGEVGQDQSEEIARLRQEKERLNAELKGAMEAMGGVLNDYSSVLAEDGASDTEANAEEQSGSADDGIVVEEIAGGPPIEQSTEETAKLPAEEVAGETTEPPAEEAAGEAAESPAEETAKPPAEEAAESPAEETAKPPAAAVTEEIDIPDYSGSEETS